VTALWLGGTAAMLLRIAFAIMATLLLRLPLLQAACGVVLLYIAIHLLAEREGQQLDEEAELVPDPQYHHRHTHKRRASWQRCSPLLTIAIADVTMSLDNVLAVGALAAGNIPVLAGGLVLSIALVMLGSALVAELISHLPWLLDLAALVLGWTAANMILHDLRLGLILAHLALMSVMIPALALAMVATFDLHFRWRAEQTVPRGNTPTTVAGQAHVVGTQIGKTPGTQASDRMLDTMPVRRRAGFVSLLITLLAFGLTGALAGGTGNWRWFLYGAPIFILAAVMGLIWLVTPPPAHRDSM